MGGSGPGEGPIDRLSPEQCRYPRGEEDILNLAPSKDTERAETSFGILDRVTGTEMQ